MSVKLEIFDTAGWPTREREILPDDSYPLAFFHPRYGCKTNLPRVALIGCQENDTTGYVYMLDMDEVEIADRQIVVPKDVLVDKEPEFFRMGVPYQLSMATGQNGEASRFLIATHTDQFSADLEEAVLAAPAMPHK
jgi:hypothetical protein